MSAPTDHLALQARMDPTRLAAVELASGRRWTYAQLDTAVARCARVLVERGCQVGDRVASLARNRVSLVVLHLACARIGAIYTPLNWRLSPAEIAALIEDAEPRLVIGDGELAKAGLRGLPLDDLEHATEVVAPLWTPAFDRDRPSLILYTSGTSGRPKGVLLSERSIEQTAINFGRLGRLTHDSAFLIDSPMFHVIGLVTAEGLRNYLARLGWGHGDDEVFNDDQAIEWFDVKDVVKAPARLDWAKLNHINSQHLRVADDARLADLVLKALTAQGAALPADAAARLLAVVPQVKEGAKTILELAEHCAFALKIRPLGLEEKTTKQLNEETIDRLKRLRDRLAQTPAWDVEALGTLLKSFAESEAVGFGKFGPSLRGVLTGGSQAPDLNKIMTAIGREETLGRLDDALATRA